MRHPGTAGDDEIPLLTALHITTTASPGYYSRSGKVVVAGRGYSKSLDQLLLLLLLRLLLVSFLGPSLFPPEFTSHLAATGQHSIHLNPSLFSHRAAVSFSSIPAPVDHLRAGYRAPGPSNLS